MSATTQPLDLARREQLVAQIRAGRAADPHCRGKCDVIAAYLAPDIPLQHFRECWFAAEREERSDSDAKEAGGRGQESGEGEQLSRTPQEVHADRVADLESLLADGAIDQEEFDTRKALADSRLKDAG